MQVKKINILVVLFSIIVLSACSVKKQIAKQPSYQSLSLRGQATLGIDDQQYVMNCAVRLWPNELIIISLQPMLGIELVRAEATPDSIFVYEKMNRRYTAITYESINHMVKPDISYTTLQNFVTQSTVAGTTTTNKWIMALGDHQITLSYNILNSEKNTLSQPTRTNSNKYKSVSLREILPL